MAVSTGYFVGRQADTLLPHRILCDGRERLWLFFHNGLQSLSGGFSDLRGEVWTPPRELLAGVSGPFSACFDAAGRELHLAARGLHPQDIHHLGWNGREWSATPVFDARRSGSTTYSPQVLSHDGCLHLLFAARQYTGGSWRVLHLRRRPGGGIETGGFNLTGPQTLAGLEKELAFLPDIFYWSGYPAADARGVLHLVFRAFRRGGYQLFYTFLPPGGQWADPLPLAPGEQCRGHPCLYPDADRLFILFQSGQNGRGTLKILAGDGERWETAAAAPLESGEVVLAGGFLPGSGGPRPYWAGPGGCRLLPLGGHGPETILAPGNGKSLGSLSAAPAGKDLCLAWTEREDPGREIYFERFDQCL